MTALRQPRRRSGQSDLLRIPVDAGRLLLQSGGLVLCHYLKTEKFAQFCRDRGIAISADRLLTLERLGLFSPVFRLRQPDEDRAPLALPITSSEWFERGWALDTAAGLPHWIPDKQGSDTEAYYSMFQIASLQLVVAEYTLEVSLEEYLHAPRFDAKSWSRIGRQVFSIRRGYKHDLTIAEFRPAIDLLCQYISDRYYPKVRTNMRTRQVSGGGHAWDEWTVTDSTRWKWEEYAQKWDAREVERLFTLTPGRLAHAYDTLAGQQAWEDPLDRWYSLVQFVAVRERDRLKGSALAAETMRNGAHMLRLLHNDLYGTDLPHPNEIYRQITVPMPEPEVRSDVRRHLEFVVNQYDLNPRPKLTLFVEGLSEDLIVRQIFERYFGVTTGTLAIEIITLGGVDNATGTKEDRFRAILRLIDYLHHHQTFAFLILDDERHARKLKHGARETKSLLHPKRYVTRPEYVKVWRKSFEFDNFSASEIATALSRLSRASFDRRDIASCLAATEPGAALMALFRTRAGSKLNKVRLAQELTDIIFAPESRRAVSNRPIVKVLDRIVGLAARNPFPTRQEDWEYNQTSTYLGKTRGAARSGRRRP